MKTKDWTIVTVAASLIPIIGIIFFVILYNDSIADNSRTIQTQQKLSLIVSSVQSKNKIALLEPTFTEAAYNNAFYVFYKKYDSLSKGEEVLTDLRNLTSSLDRSTNTTLNKNIQQKMTIVLDQIKKVIPSANVYNIKDQDVDNGKLILNDTSNNFDVLIVLHEEYVTQKMYDDFKRFVSNGGVILFLDANFFFAEVNYDKEKKAVTLIRGHHWEFDGKSAKKDVAERWYNETKEWTGGNFWDKKPYDVNINFTNNIFNYVHHEEEYVNNLNDVIILDYGAYATSDNIQKKIATYKLDYGKGKVIVFGLYGEDILKNKKFLGFFDNMLSEYVENNSTRG